MARQEWTAESSRPYNGTLDHQAHLMRGCYTSDNYLGSTLGSSRGSRRRLRLQDEHAS